LKRSIWRPVSGLMTLGRVSDMSARHCSRVNALWSSRRVAGMIMCSQSILQKRGYKNFID